MISWGFYKLVLEQLTFFDLNRSYLIGSLLASLLIPLLSFDYFTQEPLLNGVMLPSVWVGGEVSEIPAAEFIFNLTWQELLLSAYVLGVVFMVIQVLAGLTRSFILIGKSKQIKSNGLTFAIHEDFKPASFFHFVLLPEYLPTDPDQQQIVIHESIHVSKKHTYDLLLIQLTKILLWFNPIIYLFEKSLREIHEFQADQGVTQSYSSFDYSRLLVRLISGQKSFECIHYFSQFQTKKRIIMMNKAKSSPLKKNRFLFFFPLIAILVVVFACENQSTKEESIVIMENPDKETMPDQDGLYKNLPITESAPDEVFDVVEESPSPVGGIEGWIDYLVKNLEYPKEARQAGVEGMVLVSFIVNTDGSLSDAFVEKGIGSGCDEEALRVINQAPKWNPGKQGDKEVRVRMRLPINFKLGSENQAFSSNKLFQHRFAGFELTPQGMKVTETNVIPMDPSKAC